VAFTINTNIASLQAQQYLQANSDFQSKTINRVTSGLRIVNAGDDAAGLAIANGYRSDQAVLTQGIRNANDGVATLQTIDGGVSNISKLLDRARTLAAQSASDTFTGDRNVLNNEFQNVLTEIDRQAQSIGLVSGGDFAKTLSVFIGGGRDMSTAGGSSSTTNGSVAIDLSGTLVDKTSLGLASNGVSGSKDLRASATNLNGAVTDANKTDAQFTFRGKGFETGVVLHVDISGVKNEQDLTSALNKAIQGLSATNSSVAAAGVRATVDSSTGKLSFSSSAAVQVSATNSSAQKLWLGAGDASDKYSTGTFATSTIGWTDMATTLLGTSDQTINIAYKDGSGVLQNKQVALQATTTTSVDIDSALKSINTALDGTDIFAVKDGASNIVFTSAKGTSFQVDIGAATTTTLGPPAVPLAEGVGSGTASVVSAATSGSTSATDISSSANAVAAVTAISAASKALGVAQATIGKAQNQLNYAISLASTQLTNLAASESRIRDADLASEAANLTKAQILQQAGVAALAQANSAPQAVLSLLRG
jgi:flagellin